MLLLLRVFGCCLPVCLSPSISRAFSSHGTRLPPGSKPLPGCVEGSMIILDTIEQLMQSEMENVQSVLGKALEVLLLLMQRNQSIEVMKCIFATERAFVMKYPELIFYAETEQCAELCARLLQHCSSIVPEIRSWACASLNLLMRQNFEIPKMFYVHHYSTLLILDHHSHLSLSQDFARVKVQVTVALSCIVAGTSVRAISNSLSDSLPSAHTLSLSLFLSLMQNLAQRASHLYAALIYCKATLT